VTKVSFPPNQSILFLLGPIISFYTKSPHEIFMLCVYMPHTRSHVIGRGGANLIMRDPLLKAFGVCYVVRRSSRAAFSRVTVGELCYMYAISLSLIVVF